MLFHVYGDHALSQWAAMLCVLLALILLNEFARRTKAGGLLMFGVIPERRKDFGAGKGELF